MNDVNLARRGMHEFEQSHTKLMAQAGKLGGILIQLPPYFGEEHTGNLLRLISSISTGEYRIFVEVRNKNLYGNRDFEAKISDEKGNMVVVDSPEITLSENIHTRGNTTYFRFHGRNNSIWSKRGPDRNARYDYEYSRTELVDIKSKILSATRPGDEIFIFFNNHPSGKAPKNAALLMDLLGIKRGNTRQKTLI